jgi:hypothetical protein
MGRKPLLSTQQVAHAEIERAGKVRDMAQFQGVTADLYGF